MLELTVTREPKPWRFWLSRQLVRLAARVIGVPMVIRVEPVQEEIVLPKVSEYLQLDGEFDGYPKKWRRRARLHKILGPKEKP